MTDVPQAESENIWVIDSGSMTHVVRADMARRVLGKLTPQSGIILRGAGGHRLNYFGTAEVILEMGGQRFSLRAEVADVRHNLLSVPKLEDMNYDVVFKRDVSHISKSGWRVRVHRHNLLYQVEANLISLRMLPKTGSSAGNLVLATEALASVEAAPMEGASSCGPALIGEETAPTGGASSSTDRAADARPPANQEIKMIKDTHLPDEETRRRHVLAGHLDHAAWCDVCVQARGRDDPHKQKPDALKISLDPASRPLLEMDYTFIEQVTVLVIIWTDQATSAATVVLKKGGDAFAIRWVMRRLQQWGLHEVRLRTDAENSIIALAKSVQQEHKHTILLEQAAVQSHQSMGHVERAHRIIQEQVRVNRLEMEQHLGGKLRLTIGLGSWLVRHAVWQLNRFHVNVDWQNSAYERLQHRSYAGALVPFGEVVLARRQDDPSLGVHRYSKWDSRWRFGVWLGKTDESDQHLVMCE